MLCKDIMRRPVVYARPDETVHTAARRMRDSNVGFLPIRDAGNKLLGVLTDRDIAMRVCAEGRSPSATRVDSIMTRELVCCAPSDDITRAEKLMAARHKSRVLVVENGRAVGIISLSDLAARQVPEAAETLRHVAAREIIAAGPSDRPRR